MQRQTETVLARVSQQLSQLEKRDGELWLIVSLAGLLVGAGLLAVLFPAAFLKQGNIHFEITVSRPLVLGLVALLILLNTYLVSKRMEFRRLREQLSRLERQVNRIAKDLADREEAAHEQPPPKRAAAKRSAKPKPKASEPDGS